jgi:hypothetical protein
MIDSHFAIRVVEKDLGWIICFAVIGVIATATVVLAAMLGMFLWVTG